MKRNAKKNGWNEMNEINEMNEANEMDGMNAMIPTNETKWNETK